MDLRERRSTGTVGNTDEPMLSVPLRRRGDHADSVRLPATWTLSGESVGQALTRATAGDCAFRSPPGPGDILVLSSDGDVLTAGTSHAGPAHTDARVRAAAREWARQRMRAERRMGLVIWLMAYIDGLSVATCAEDVCRSVVGNAALMLDTFVAITCRVDGSQGAGVVVTQDPAKALSLPPIRPEAISAYSELVIVSDGPARSAAAGESIACLVDAFAAAHLVWAPVNPDVVLVLAERRRDRLFTSEDRDLLAWVAKQANRRLADIAVRHPPSAEPPA